MSPRDDAKRDDAAARGEAGSGAAREDAGRDVAAARDDSTRDDAADCDDANRDDAHARIVAEQRRLWATAPDDWSELAERELVPLYDALLDALALADGARVLDVGCGSGLFCQLARARGADVAGIDVTPELLAIARSRVPAGDFREADMSGLPFPDAEFDVVAGINAFQFAPDPAVAFAEAARVLRPGGWLVAVAFAEPERNEGTALHLVMKALVDELEGVGDGYAPYALSGADGLRRAVADAGLTVVATVEVPVDWHYADADTTVRALLASAGGARAARAAGRERVIDALGPVIADFAGADGSVTIHNLFRYVIAQKA